jgi:hypothetical protein
VNDEAPQKIAVDRAWSLYLAIHTDVDPADARRCTLDRHLQQRWDFGEKDLEELTCCGLAYLSRLPCDDS